MSHFYDALETRDPIEREAALMAALPAQVAHAQKTHPPSPKHWRASMPPASTAVKLWRLCL
jgi:hypothetical protein